MIIFSKKAYQKIRHFVSHTSYEISGLGKSRFIDNRTILVQDIEILDQENSFSGTTIDEGAMAKFLQKNINESKDWNIWWHSHANMETFWSFTDEQTIEETTGGNYLLSIVVNRKMSMLARFDLFNPLRLTLELDVKKPKGRSKQRQKQYLTKYCQDRIKTCIREIEPYKFQFQGFKGKKKFSTQKNIKSLLESLEQETLDQQRPMD